MAIFLLLFAIAVSYIFTWTQDQGTYVNAINTQANLDRNRLSENLLITAFNSSSLNVQNPTSMASVITQIWSNDAEIWSGFQGISPFGNFTFNNQTISGWNSTALGLSNGNFEIVTLNGNAFSGGVQTQFSEAITDTWNVTWYYNATAGQPSTPAGLASSTYLGNSYWYDLNFDWLWSVASNPVIANYNLSASPASTLGFIANTTLIKTTGSQSSISISYYNDLNSTVQFAIDGQLQPLGTNPITFNGGSQYSVHTITVYYLMNTTGINSNNIFSYVYSLKLNVFNATFAP